jgi:hypothetical protein
MKFQVQRFLSLPPRLDHLWGMSKANRVSLFPQADGQTDGFTLIINCVILLRYDIYNDCKSRDSSVGIALGFGLDDWGSRVRFPAGTGNFSLHHRVQKGSGAHPATYPMGSRGSFPGGKAAGA